MPRRSRIITMLPKRLRPAWTRLLKTYGTASRRVTRFIAKWFLAPKAVAVIPIEQVLRGAHERLLGLQRRRYLLEAIDAEWPRITRGKGYWLHGDATFRAIEDVDAMNVIDLCSWGNGASDSDESLLVRVRDHYLAALPPARRWSVQNASASLIDGRYAAARARLFPKAAERALTEADAEDLIEEFEKRIAPLRDDRNKNRAHAYENKTHGTAKPLDFAELREMYRYARQVLNDLSEVAFGGKWPETDVNSNNVKRTAEDPLDGVFLPQWFRQEMAGRGMSREALYDALHADPRPGHFNDRPKLLTLAGREPQPTG